MKKIAIFTRNYLPDIKAGGPVRSIENLVNAIGSDCIIHIITLDSLMISTNKSTIYIKEVGKSKVYYLKNNIDKYAKILTIILNGNYDFIYNQSKVFWKQDEMVFNDFMEKVMVLKKKLGG